MLPDGVEDRVRMWIESGKGFKSVRSDELKNSIPDRDDVPQVKLNQKLDRGDRAQTLRLKYYPSIDVEFEKLYAGTYDGTLDEAEDKLMQMGYRNNPTAYVEVTEEHGPDDGSYARQFITETQADIDRPYLSNFPAPFRRMKQQVHVTLYDTEDGVHMLAHQEKSAWLQPMQHVIIPRSKARVGVQALRIDWYNEYREELGGRGRVRWDVPH